MSEPPIPPHSEGEDAVDAAFNEFLDQYLLGRNPDPDALLEKYPTIRKELSSRLIAFRDFKEAVKSHDSDFKALDGMSSIYALRGYELIKEIGRGGFGVVYEAKDIASGKIVALKILKADARLEPKLRERFRREGITAQIISHPNIIPVYAVGEEAGTSFIVMEYIRGEALDKILKGSSLLDQEPPMIWVERFLRVVEALAYLHGEGIIHRDIKPSNLILTNEGELLLTDFGLASQEGAPTITATGELLGTPAYMSPEQASMGEIPVDHRSDIYSLGASFYEILTGRRPHPQGNYLEVLKRIRTEYPLPLRQINRNIPRDLEAIVMKAMEKEPKRRYQKAAEMVEDISRFLRYEGVTASSISPIILLKQWIRRYRIYLAIAGAGLLLINALFIILFNWIQNNNNYAEFLSRARNALNKGDHKLAFSYYDGALHIYPNKKEPYMGREAALAMDKIDTGNALLCRGLIEDAFEIYNDAISDILNNSRIMDKKRVLSMAGALGDVEIKVLLSHGSERFPRYILQKVPYPPSEQDPFTGRNVRGISLRNEFSDRSVTITLPVGRYKIDISCHGFVDIVNASIFVLPTISTNHANSDYYRSKYNKRTGRNCLIFQLVRKEGQNPDFDPSREVFIPAGDFICGGRMTRKDMGTSYPMLRHIEWTNGFFIDKYEVSIEDFLEFDKAGGYTDSALRTCWDHDALPYLEGAECSSVTSGRFDISDTGQIKISSEASDDENKFSHAWWIGSYALYNDEKDMVLLTDREGKIGPWLRGIQKEQIDLLKYPAFLLSWYEANAYAAWRGKRLPTASEWERAAGGIDGWIYPWGNLEKGDLARRCIICMTSSLYSQWISHNKKPIFPWSEYDYGFPLPVKWQIALKDFDTDAIESHIYIYDDGILNASDLVPLCSPSGCVNLHGNVWEWIAGEPHGLAKGGSWNNPFPDSRTCNQFGWVPFYRSMSHGFRCARDLPKK